MTIKEKVNLIIKDIENESYSVYSDVSEIEDRRNLLKALEQNHLSFNNKGFYGGCPHNFLPGFKCDERCCKDYKSYKLRLECWEEALKDD